MLGVLGVARMEKAYGTRIEGPELAILMRHRAVLFGLLSGLMAWAMFDLGGPAIIRGLVSDVAFAMLCLGHREHVPAIDPILGPDVASIVVLSVAAGIVLGG